MTALFVGPAWLPWLALALCVAGGGPYLMPLLTASRARGSVLTSEATDADSAESQAEVAVAGVEPTSDVVVGSSDLRSAKGDAASIKPGSVEGAGLVAVLPGRRRYHRLDCELVINRQPEVMTLDDAIDEEFSACSRCGGR